MPLKYFLFYNLIIVFITMSRASNSSYIRGPPWSKSIKSRADVFNFTAPSEHPYAVMVLLMGNDRNIRRANTCSGSILTKKWILTAGHCIGESKEETKFHYLYTQFTIYAGGNTYDELLEDNMPPGSQALWADLAITHPKKQERIYDIGIIRVSGPGFRFNQVVKMIKILVTPYYRTNYNKCYVTGFGQVEYRRGHEWDGRRKTQEVKIVNYNRKCPCESQVFYSFPFEEPRKWLICTNPKDFYGICPGDSGAGLVCNGNLIGVATHFAYFNFEICRLLGVNTTCGDKYSMSFFYDTCNFFSWIIPQVDPRPDFYPYIPNNHECWNTEVAFE